MAELPTWSSSEDVAFLLRAMSDAALRSRSAFPVHDMLQRMEDESRSIIEDVNLKWRLGSRGDSAVEVAIRTQDNSVHRACIGASQWEAILGHNTDAVSAASNVGGEGAVVSPVAGQLEVLRAKALYAVIGHNVFDIKKIEEQCNARMHEVDGDTVRLIRQSIVLSSLAAAASLRRLPMFEYLLGLRKSPRQDTVRMPKPVCVVQQHGGVFMIPETRVVCRTICSAVEVFSQCIDRFCARTSISDEVFSDATFPAFQTSSEEEFHALSTLIGPLSEEAKPFSVQLGLLYVPLKPSTEKPNTKKRGFVVAPPPPVPYSDYHCLFAAPTERTSAEAAGSVCGKQKITFVKVRTLSDLRAVAAGDGIAVVDPLDGNWLLADLLEQCQELAKDQATFAVDLSEIHCGGATGCDGDSGLPAFALACGASYVWLPPPRGSHATSLYNEFLRIEETVNRRYGCCCLVE